MRLPVCFVAHLRSAGSLFLDHVRAGLVTLEDAVEAVRSHDGIVRGRLHLGILQSLGPYLQLPLLLQRFRSTFPQIEFAVRAMSNDTIPAEVRSGSVDLSFYAVIGKAEWPGVRFIPYAEDSLVAFCSLCSTDAIALRIRGDRRCNPLLVDAVAHSLNRPNATMTNKGERRAHLRKCESVIPDNF